MPLLNISSAARAVEKNRATLHRYINEGRLSTVRDEAGHVKIDTSELLRVFGNLATDGITQETKNATPKQQQTTGDYEILRQRLQLALEHETWLKTQLESALEHNRELERRLLDLSLLKGQTALPTMTNSTKGFFARLLGR